MEFFEDSLLEELQGLRELEVFTNQELSTIYNINNWNTLDFTFPTTNEDFFLPIDHLYAPFGDESSFNLDSPAPNLDNQTLPYSPQDYFYSIPFLDQDLGTGAPCKPEPVPESELSGFERKSKVKKIDGQPSKNLMAERRRRKRLNDRLSMLRSVVPKISKMDRTSILGDTIDYMKELLDRINNLQEEMRLGSSDHHLGFMGIFKDVKANDVLVRNTPKFEVEKRNEDTKIEIRCVGKPGLLLSTVTTLEALGLEIHHCVVSSFNDFLLQASCSQDLRNRGILESEELKQALLRNAGYGGRCL